MKQPVMSYKSTVATYVVYDAKNGQVVHIHQFKALPGAETPSESELEAEASTLANRITGKELSEMAAMRIRSEDIEIGVEYEKVDIEKKMLVAKKL